MSKQLNYRSDYMRLVCQEIARLKALQSSAK